MSDPQIDNRLPDRLPEQQAGAPTGPITLALTRADHPSPDIQRIWIIVDSIIALNPSQPGTPPGTVVWVMPQQAFLVSESVDQILYLMGARVYSITALELADLEASRPKEPV